MPLIRCPDCGTEMSDKAPACPKCGRPIAWNQPKGGLFMRTLNAGCSVVLLIGAVLLAMILIGYCASRP